MCSGKRVMLVARAKRDVIAEMLLLSLTSHDHVKGVYDYAWTAPTGCRSAPEAQEGKIPQGVTPKHRRQDMGALDQEQVALHSVPPRLRRQDLGAADQERATVQPVPKNDYTLSTVHLKDYPAMLHYGLHHHRHCQLIDLHRHPTRTLETSFAREIY